MSTYSQLRQIIPPDQALASKALQAGLQQVKNIFDTELPQLATATTGLESNVGLEDIGNLSGPLPANVIAYFEQTLATGSGPQGLLLLTDVIGSIAGYKITGEISNTANILGNMTTSGDFTALTNVTDGVYTVMENCIAGDYTSSIEIDPGPPPVYEYTVTIPGSLPGAGTYGPDSTANAAIGNAFNSGLNPAMISVVGTIIAANATDVANTTANFNIICDQLETQNTNLFLASVDFSNVIPGLQAWSLVNNLASTGLEVVEGGPAYVLQSIANTSTQGGQAIISTMRESRNQERLGVAGMQTDITISDQYPEPRADFGTTQYTVAQAAGQKII